MLKNVFLVGAPKCGTTKLADYFENHPQVNISSPKEVNFFSYKDLKSRNLYYDEWLCSSLEKYKKSFQNKKYAAYNCDASVSYFDSTSAPNNIKKYDNKAKIIVVLRDPVERAISHYEMDKRLGYTSKDFIEIIDSPNSEEYRQTVGLSLYFKKVNRYIELFGKENVHIIPFDSLKNSYSQTLQEMCNFLEINWQEDPNYNKLINNAIVPKNQFLGFLYKHGKLRRVLRKILPSNIHFFLRNNLFAKKSKANFDLILKNKLNDIIYDDFQKLRILVYTNFSVDIRDIKIEK